MKKWIQKYKDLKYRYKLTIMMILCSLIPVCVISGYTQIRTVQIMREKEQIGLEQVLEQSVNSIDNRIQIYTNLINYLTSVSYTHLGLIISVLGFDETGTALILTIFALQDSFGTACNVTGDGALTMILTGFAEKHKIEHKTVSCFLQKVILHIKS